jgi:hypothetical protein
MNSRPPLRLDRPPPPTRPARPAPPAVGRHAAALLSALAAKTRYVDPELCAIWPALAGAELARLCRPGRLSGGRSGRTLEIVVPHGAAAAAVEFASDGLKRRLNAYFGPESIARIAIVHGSAAAPKSGLLSRFRHG